MKQIASSKRLKDKSIQNIRRENKDSFMTLVYGEGKKICIISKPLLELF